MSAQSSGGGGGHFGNFSREKAKQFEMFGKLLKWDWEDFKFYETIYA